MSRAKQMASLLVLLTGAAMVVPQAAMAAVQDETTSLSMNATVSAIHMLTVGAKNISDNSPAFENTIAFGAVDGSANLVPPQYMEVNYQSNEANWGVNIWSDYARTATEPSAYLGGLHKDFTSDIGVPLAWQLSDAPVATPAAPADFGNLGSWNMIKSKKDSDWSLTNGVLINQFTTVTSPVAVYFAAMFKSQNPPPGFYAANIGCDLFHE